MSDYPVRIERLKGQGIVRVAAKHNLREIAAEIGAAGHINPALIHTNLVLRGPASADKVASNAKALMADAGITRQRVGSVMALELVFTLRPNPGVDVREYFEDATRWAERFYQVPVLSSVVHLDEAAPHCHVLLLPIVEGHMVGSDLHGGRAKLIAMQASFQEQVRALYGMARYAPAKRHSAAVRGEAMELAYTCLNANYGLAGPLLAAILKPHAKDPEPLLLELGLSMPMPRQSFVAIMTRPTKPEQRNPIGKGSANLIGKAQHPAPVSMLPYPCVGKGGIEPPASDPLQSQPGMTEPTSPSTSPTTKEAKGNTARADETRAADEQREAYDYTADTDHASEPVEQLTRERDDERPTREFDTTMGAWIQPTQNTGSERALAATQVQEALSRAQLPQQPCSTTHDKPECSEPRKQDDEEGGD